MHDESEDVTDIKRPEVLEVEVEASVLLDSGERVKVRDRISGDMLDVMAGGGFRTLCNTIRRRLIRAANLKGAAAQDMLGKM